MKFNEKKEVSKEKEEALKTPTYASILAPTPGTTTATKEDVATLRRIIDESERRSEERMQEMRALIEIMTAAVSRQPNVSKDVKNALPQLEAIIDHLEEANRDGNEARRKLSSFVASTGGSGNKRQASASPLAPSEGAKLAKKKKGGATVQKPSPDEWTVFQNDKKKKKKEGKGLKQGNTMSVPKTPKTNKAKRRPRSEAIALRPAEGKTYAEILGGIRSRVDPTKCETEIKAVRKTRSGDVLIEIRKTTAEGRQGFTDALREALGESGSVRVLVPRTTLEIRDMDSCTTVEEVELALRKKLQTYEGKLEVRLTRPNAAGQRMAVFSIEEEAAARLLETARICIGWISCRLRRREQLTRCFRCLGYGHESRACKGPDRSNQCYRCGSVEHKVADCKASPKCFLCTGGSLGHVAGSGSCRVF